MSPLFSGVCSMTKTKVLSITGPRVSRRNIFIKVSGDEYLNPAFQKWVGSLSRKSWVVICSGGGTAISRALNRLGNKTTFGPMGREILDFGQKQTARNVLEKIKIELEDVLAEKKIHVAVAIPVLSLGEVLCHVNGDYMVRLAYLGFDELYVVTTPERLKTKKEEFKDLPKVRVKAFPL